MAEQPEYDLVGIGNALVDVVAQTDDAFLDSNELSKGGMMLVDADQSSALYDRMPPGTESSGGSCANTMAGFAALGGNGAYIGKVRDDQFGTVFRHDMQALGCAFDTAAATDGPATGRCLVLVTPDGQRTLNTYLGASQHLSGAAIDKSLIGEAAVLYLEGYLWDPDEARLAMRGAIDAARAAGRKVAFTLSDAFLLNRHGDDFRGLIDDGLIDILFANEAELLGLTGVNDFEAGIAALAPKLPVLVVTRSEKGAVAIAGGERAEVPAQPATVLDTTGAGDCFAAGFLHGHVQGKSLSESLTIGAVAAAEVISHYGARPEADLQALVRETLG